MRFRILLITSAVVLWFESRSQSSLGYDMGEDHLTVDCRVVAHWKSFNEIDFSDIRQLWIYNLEPNDTIDFQQFELVTELVLDEPRSAINLNLAQLFPNLQKLEVYSETFSNVSYAGLQNIISLEDLTIRDPFFCRTFEIFAFDKLKRLHIGDKSSLNFIRGHLIDILPSNLDCLEVSCRSTQVVNSFLISYFESFSCRKLSVKRTRGIELYDSYVFQLFVTDKYPKIIGYHHKSSKRIVIESNWIKLGNHFNEYMLLSEKYLVDIAAKMGFVGCPETALDSQKTQRLNLYYLNPRASNSKCDSLFITMSMNNWKILID